MAAKPAEYGFHMLGNETLSSSKEQVRTLSSEAVALFLGQFPEGEREDVAAELINAIVESADDPREAAKDLHDELEARINL